MGWGGHDSSSRAPASRTDSRPLAPPTAPPPGPPVPSLPVPPDLSRTLAPLGLLISPPHPAVPRSSGFETRVPAESWRNETGWKGSAGARGDRGQRAGVLIPAAASRSSQGQLMAKPRALPRLDKDPFSARPRRNSMAPLSRASTGS